MSAAGDSALPADETAAIRPSSSSDADQHLSSFAWVRALANRDLEQRKRDAAQACRESKCGRWKLTQVAVLVRDAVHGRHATANVGKHALRWYMCFHAKSYEVGYAIVVTVMCLLPVFETPSSFNSFASEPIEECVSTQLFVIELVLVFALIADLWVRVQAIGVATLWANAKNKF